jgi:hypothetical protein
LLSAATASLYYVHRLPDGPTWEQGPLRTLGGNDYGNLTSLKVDAWGGVHVSFCDGESMELWYARRCP